MNEVRHTGTPPVLIHLYPSNLSLKIHLFLESLLPSPHQQSLHPPFHKLLFWGLHLFALSILDCKLLKARRISYLCRMPWTFATDVNFKIITLPIMLIPMKPAKSMPSYLAQPKDNGSSSAQTANFLITFYKVQTMMYRNILNTATCHKA